MFDLGIVVERGMEGEDCGDAMLFGWLVYIV